MEADLPIAVPGWLATASPGVLLALAILLILTGRLVPRPLYREMVKDRDMWRQAAQKQAEHTATLLPTATIATQVMQALAGATGVNGVEHDDPGEVPP